MKKIFSSLITVIIIFSTAGFSIQENNSDYKNKIQSGFSLKKIPMLISEKKSSGNFERVNIFDYTGSGSNDRNASEFVSASSLLRISREDSRRLLNSKPENIVFAIPVSGNEFFELELTQSKPSSDDFRLTEKTGIGNRDVAYTPGLHYNGIIKGNENSVASLSIFENFVMGVFSDETGNYVLGAVKNSDNSNSDKYIFYNDKDISVKNNFKCGVEDYEERFIKPVKEAQQNSEHNDNLVRLPVKIYFEADNKMYTDNGSNTQTVADFITGMFNSVKTIYQNESIPFEVGQIGVWTNADPYRSINDSYVILLQFGANTRDDFQGNLAHFISTRTAGLGGIAWIRVMCAEFNPGDSSGRFAFSNIDPNYNNFPTFSWTVSVVTHEMGHSMGSRHTHSCVWPVGPGGAIRAIDSCYNAEGGCFTTPRARIGTIMSYCHLWTAAQGGGINFSSGFGPLPGDTIRLRYSQARCLDQLLNSSERPSGFGLAQNFPNPFNPTTKISFAIPVESRISMMIYDINGKIVAELINNEFYTPGFYDKTFNSAGYNLASGIYFYSLLSEGKLIASRQMILIK